MSNKNSTDFHKPDQAIFKGEKLGHGSKESHIRKRDGLIFNGDEIGYVDRQKNIRRPDGIILRGEVVGKVKGTTAHAKDGILFEGDQWGYVDDDGNVRQRDGITFRGRVIGKMRGHNKEAALAFFVLRFKDLVDRFERLEQEARRADHKNNYIGKVRHMLSYAPEFDGLGDFDDLIRRLRQLESDLVDNVERRRRSIVDSKEALIRDAERWSSSSEWKLAAAEVKSLQARWKEVGGAGEDENSLWGRFREACEHFFRRRTAHFEALDRERRHNANQKEQLCSMVESLRHADDLKEATSRVKDLQHQWKSIGPVSKDVNDDLWNRFRHACDAVFLLAHQERERKHEEWERKQQQWRDKLNEVLRAKHEQASRLRESIDHDEGNVSRWRDTINDLRPGGRADEIQDSLEAKISDVEERIQSKEQKLRDIENDITDIEAKLRS